MVELHCSPLEFRKTQLPRGRGYRPAQLGKPNQLGLLTMELCLLWAYHTASENSNFFVCLVIAFIKQSEQQSYILERLEFLDTMSAHVARR